MSTVTDIYDRQHIVPGPWESLSEVKKANKAIGNFWFEPDTIRFFSTRFPEGETIHYGRFFISSEVPPYSKRQFTIRIVSDDGSVSTSIHGNCVFATKAQALKAIEAAVKGVEA